MKIVYRLVTTLSGLVALDTILGFLGYSPINSGVGLLSYNDRWAQIFTVSVVVCGVSFALSLRQPAAMLALGVVLILGAIPAGIMLELSANGCCGAPSTGHRGIGLILSGGMLLAGIAAVIFGVRKLREQP